MIKSFLFVGGIRDGDWFMLPEERNTWTVPEQPKLGTLNFDPLVPPEPMTIRQETYCRMQFRGLDETYTIYAGHGLNPDKALERLIDGYRAAETQSVGQEQK